MFLPSALEPLLSQLPPGEDVVAAVISDLKEKSSPHLSRSARVQLYLLIVTHFLVFVLSVLGITLRYVKGNGWCFTREGLIRPNTAIVTHCLFAGYSAWFVVDTLITTLVGSSSQGEFLSAMLRFVLLGLAFHLITWSTALGSATSRIFLPPSARRFERSPAFRKIANALTLSSLLIFVISIIPLMLVALFRRRDFFNKTGGLLQALEDLRGSVSETEGLVGLLPQFQKLQLSGEALFHAYQQAVALYLAWGLIWLMVYVPSSMKLMNALRTRRRRIHRSLKSLRVLDGLVSSEVAESSFKVVLATPSPTHARDALRSPAREDLSIISESPAMPPPTSPRSSPSPLLLSAPSSLQSSPQLGSKSRSASRNGTLTVQSMAATATRARVFAGRMMGEVGLAASYVAEPRPKPATALRIEEALEDLVKTNRMLVTIAVQFGLVLSMFSSYFAFCIYVIDGHGKDSIQTLYVFWTGWTFAVPALCSASFFTLLSLRGPPPPSPPKSSTSLLPPSPSSIDELSYNPSPPHQLAESNKESSIETHSWFTNTFLSRRPTSSLPSTPFRTKNVTRYSLQVRPTVTSVFEPPQDARDTQSHSQSSDTETVLVLSKPSEWALAHANRFKYASATL